MIDLLIEVLPSQKQTIGLLSVFLASLAMSIIGRAISSECVLGGSTLLMGWGIGSLVYTGVATLSTTNLSNVVWALLVFSFGSIIFLKRRGVELVIMKPWRLFVLGFAFLLIVSAKYPSEVDVLSHWLYNVLYLLDYGTLPRPGLPQSLSAYTGFPYNHTFALHFVSVLSGGMAESAGNVINFGLVILFAMLLANLIQLARTNEGNKNPARISWLLAALALILATYANPIFVRKIVLMANPDTATSVGLAFLGITAWQLIERVRANNNPIKPFVFQFSLISILFINLKQPNIIILFILCIGMALLLLGKDAWPRFRRLLRLSPILIGPALFSYLLWRNFVSSDAQLHEATLLPFEQWQFQNIPAILSSFWANAVKKAGYFGLMTILAILAGIKLFKPKTSFDRLAILAAVVFIGWNGVLFFLYIAHWTGHASTGASSYWRYNTFIGYFGYAVAIYGLSRFYFQNYLKTPFTKTFVWRVFLPRIIIGIAIVMPIVTAPYLRFDRQQPKPYLRSIGNELGASVPFGARVLVHIPGDIGDYATVMQYFANRFRSDISVAPAPSLSIIKTDLNKKEYPSPPMVWSICGSSKLEEHFALKLPENKSFLLTQRNGNWAVLKTWDWPKARFLSSYHKNIKNLRCDIKH